MVVAVFITSITSSICNRFTSFSTSHVNTIGTFFNGKNIVKLRKSKHNLHELKIIVRFTMASTTSEFHNNLLYSSTYLINFQLQQQNAQNSRVESDRCNIFCQSIARIVHFMLCPKWFVAAAAVFDECHLHTLCTHEENTIEMSYLFETIFCIWNRHFLSPYSIIMLKYTSTSVVRSHQLGSCKCILTKHLNNVFLYIFLLHVLYLEEKKKKHRLRK